MQNTTNVDDNVYLVYKVTIIQFSEFGNDCCLSGAIRCSVIRCNYRVEEVY